MPSPYGVSVPTGSARSAAPQFLAPSFKFWAFKFYICPALLATSSTDPIHECHLLAETGLESDANIFMFGLRTGEIKHHILIVNQHLSLKEALTSRIVFWRSFHSSVLFLHYSRRNASTHSHLKSEMATANIIPSLSPYLAIYHIIPSSFCKPHPHTQNFCIAFGFKRITLCFLRAIIQDAENTFIYIMW